MSLFKQNISFFRHQSKYFLISSLSLFMSYPCLAQTTPSNLKQTSPSNSNKSQPQINLNTPTNPSIKEESNIKYSMGLNFALEQSVKDNDRGDKDRILAIELNPRIDIGNFYFMADQFYNYSLNNPQNQSDWSDGLFHFSYQGMHIVPAIKFTSRLTFEPPFSKKSRENNGTRMITDLTGIFGLDSNYLNIPQLSLSYALTYGHFTNDFTTRADGSPATKYKIVQVLKSKYDIENLYLLLYFKYTSNFSYENVARDTFIAQEGVGYNFTDNVGVLLYHYNAGPVFKSPTYENNLNLYDEDSSTLGLELDLSF